ncbi:hypothetical protein DL93DRAFT_2078849, partial [Clavulina sp. PMI_390]
MKLDRLFCFSFPFPLLTFKLTSHFLRAGFIYCILLSNMPMRIKTPSTLLRCQPQY